MEYVIEVYGYGQPLFYSRHGYFYHDRKAVKGWSPSERSVMCERAKDLRNFLALDTQVVIRLR